MLKRTILIAAILIVLILSACGPAAPGASSQGQSQQNVPSDAGEKPVVPTQTFMPVSQDVSGYTIQVSLTGVQRDGKQVNADVCFTVPDDSDWTVWQASLKYGTDVISEFGSSLKSLQLPADGQPGLRCDVLNFYVPPDADLSNAVLTVDSVAAYPSEGDYCSKYFDIIQQSLDANNTGVVIQCTTIDGIASLQIVSKPDSMTQEQAEQLVYSDQYYSVKGPWTFNINLGQ